MMHTSRTIRIVMADDDRDDQLMMKRAFDKAGLSNPLEFVNDGEELMYYLRKAGSFESAEVPDLILLDLNMPRKNGWEALQELKADPELRRIPVIILTSSCSDYDLLRSYDLGANSYIAKPMDIDGLVGIVKALALYWFKTVHLPETL